MSEVRKMSGMRKMRSRIGSSNKTRRMKNRSRRSEMRKMRKSGMRRMRRRMMRRGAPPRWNT